jgi:hypothetical protein
LRSLARTRNFSPVRLLQDADQKILHVVNRVRDFGQIVAGPQKLR